VGVMGGGGRHEHLALGETPNIAAWLQALVPANTVVMSAVTVRLVQGTFALEDLGTHTLHGVSVLEDNPSAAERVYDAIIDSVARLVTFPLKDEISYGQRLVGFFSRLSRPAPRARSPRPLGSAAPG